MITFFNVVIKHLLTNFYKIIYISHTNLNWQIRQLLGGSLKNRVFDDDSKEAVRFGFVFGLIFFSLLSNFFEFGNLEGRIYNLTAF